MHDVYGSVNIVGVVLLSGAGILPRDCQEVVDVWRCMYRKYRLPKLAPAVNDSIHN